MKVFCERLKEMRKLCNYTQRDMANKLGIAQPSYARYENGSSEPTLERLANIATILDCSTDHLLGLKEF